MESLLDYGHYTTITHALGCSPRQARMIPTISTENKGVETMFSSCRALPEGTSGMADIGVQKHC
jgi:hypothetical protein